MFKSPTSVQAVPFHNSASPSGPAPPKAIPAVDLPAPDNPLLAVFKSPTSVQEAPFQDSAIPVLASVKPPKSIVAVDVPKLEHIRLAVLTSATSDHELPLYCSTVSTFDPGPASPTIKIAAVCIPEDAPLYLA